MSDKTFALVTVLVSGVFGLLVASLTVWLASRREMAAHQLKWKQEGVERLRIAYIDALTILEAASTQMDGWSAEFSNEVNRVAARLLLLDDQTRIASQFLTAAARVAEATREASKAGLDVERRGTVSWSVLKTGDETAARASSAWTDALVQVGKLRVMMKHDLEARERSDASNPRRASRWAVA